MQLLASRAPVIIIDIAIGSHGQAIKGGPAMQTAAGSAAADSQGAPSHVRDLRASLERLGVPVFLSGMARGLLGAQHPLLLRHARSKILRKADAVMLVGVPADFRSAASHSGRRRPLPVPVGRGAGVRPSVMHSPASGTDRCSLAFLSLRSRRLGCPAAADWTTVATFRPPRNFSP